MADVAGVSDPQHRNRVLVVDDDDQLRQLLALVLSSEGYDVTPVSTVQAALDHVRERRPHLVVLDVVLGDQDGRTLLAEIRRTGDLPVILVSGHGDTAERVLGLRLGADDFLTKPFSPVELVARVETVLRRAAGPAAPPVAGSDDPDGLRIDEGAREVHVAGRLVELTAREFDLLAFLARSPRQVFSRGALLERVWNSNSAWQTEATVTEHVRRLRYKIEDDPEHPRWITTVRGVGYRFEP